MTYLRLLKPESYGSFVDFLVGYLVVISVSAYLEHLTTLFSIFVSFAIFLYPGIYIMNHLIDLPQDRRHPVKKHRPLASGAVRPWIGTVIASGLILLGLSLGYWILPEVFFFEIAFLLLNMLYTIVIKPVSYLELVWVTMTHPLRTVFAICIFGRLEARQWPFLMVITLIWLGFNTLKRYKELVEVGDTVRPTLKRYSKKVLLCLAIACAIALFTLFFWANSSLALLVIFGGNLYYLTLLLGYFKGRGGGKRFIDYMLAN